MSTSLPRRGAGVMKCFHNATARQILEQGILWKYWYFTCLINFLCFWANNERSRDTSSWCKPWTTCEDARKCSCASLHREICTLLPTDPHVSLTVRHSRTGWGGVIGIRVLLGRSLLSSYSSSRKKWRCNFLTFWDLGYSCFVLEYVWRCNNCSL